MRKWRFRGWAAALLGLAGVLSVAGCGAQPGRSTVSWNNGNDPPPLVEAPDDATFALYEKKGTNPIWSGKLDEGDKYGFRRNEAGEVVGYTEEAGEIPLPKGFTTQGYIWSMQEE